MDPFAGGGVAAVATSPRSTPELVGIERGWGHRLGGPAGLGGGSVAGDLHHADGVGGFFFQGPSVVYEERLKPLYGFLESVVVAQEG